MVSQNIKRKESGRTRLRRAFALPRYLPLRRTFVPAFASACVRNGGMPRPWRAIFSYRGSASARCGFAVPAYSCCSFRARAACCSSAYLPSGVAAYALVSACLPSHARIAGCLLLCARYVLSSSPPSCPVAIYVPALYAAVCLPPLPASPAYKR